MKRWIGMLLSVIIVCAVGNSLAAQEEGTVWDIQRYDVAWDSPSKGYTGSMPLGNGDIGLNAWMEENGDLCFYISKTDTWDDNNQLVKVGKVRVTLTPNPLTAGAKFRQTLALETGEIVVEIAGAAGPGGAASKTVVRLWVDANHPVVHVTAEGSEPLTATARAEIWRKEPYEMQPADSDVQNGANKPGTPQTPTIAEPDTVLANQSNRIGWYHHNKKSVGPELSMRIQGLTGYKMSDPILRRTFGAILTAPGGKRVDDLTLTTTPGKSQRIHVYVRTEHPSTPEDWLRAMDETIRAVEGIPFDRRRAEHERWWSDFWNRSWILASEDRPSSVSLTARPTGPEESDTFVLNRAYMLQRFINACAGRGRYPIKFNGTIFVVPYPGKAGDADFRGWGSAYWWQNTRLPYTGMCAAGDYDLMQPLFQMYGEDVFELSKYRTKHYFGYGGAYFAECIFFWGACQTATYGWEPFEQRQDKLQTFHYHKWEWVCGPELVCMMLDYYEHTQDEKFLKEKILPLAREVMVFFENFYKTGPDGKLVMHPSQALETWQDCTNPMPEVAGLRAVTRRLLALPENLTTSEARAFCQTFRRKLPELPTREEKGVRMLAPADKFALKRNEENPELYAVFPFREIAIGKPNIELGIEAQKNRWDKGNFGWRQEEIFMAYLGLTQEAKKNLVGRARNFDKNSRFPAFWGPNYDWVPDQDHGGVLMKAFQAMLMQTEGRAIYLLPAWPREWDADFKLHAPYRTTVQGQVRKGRVVNLKVEPAERAKDVSVLEAK